MFDAANECNVDSQTEPTFSSIGFADDAPDDADALDFPTDAELSPVEEAEMEAQYREGERRRLHRLIIERAVAAKVAGVLTVRQALKFGAMMGHCDITGRDSIARRHRRCIVRGFYEGLMGKPYARGCLSPAAAAAA